MLGVRKALIVATDEYDDPGLAQLRAPEHDADALAEVLADPAIGNFHVETVTNAVNHEVARAVARFLRSGKPGDVFVVHFSCHGVKADDGQLYFAARDTSLDLLEPTAVSSTFVNDEMFRSRAATVLLMLDCCYSGAFGRGMTHRAGSVVDVGDHLGGSGRAVITASSALQYAFEDGSLADVDVSATPSVFTHAVVSGLTTGDADHDLDGEITLGEFYQYIHDEVVRANPAQTPRLFVHDVEGDLLIANRKTPVTTPSELPADIREDLASTKVSHRKAAIEELSELLAGAHPGRALAARLALQRLAASDDSFSVREKATAVLAVAGLPLADDREVATRPAVVTEDRGAAEDEVVPADRATAGAGPATEELVATEEPIPRHRYRTWWAGRRRWLLPTIAAASTLALIVVPGVFFWPGGKDSADGPAEPQLKDSEVLLTRDLDDVIQLVRQDVDGGEPVVVKDDPLARLPTISPDRRWMVYLEGNPKRGNPSKERVPHLARVDGSDDRLLLDTESSKRCPNTFRPAWSPDGDQLAVVCRDDNLDPTGLWTVGLDGSLRVQLDPSTRPSGDPTWGGDHWVYYARTGRAPDARTAIWRVPEEGGEPERWTREGGWASHPDWSEGGLLYQRSQAPKEPGDLCLQSPTVSRCWPVAGSVDSPTWSPDGSTVAWIQATTGSIEVALFTAAGLDSEPTQLDLMGKLGPPAWGSR